MENIDRIIMLEKNLTISQEPIPILIELLGFLNSDASEHAEKAQSALLSYFDFLRKSAPHQTMGNTIKALRIECADETPASFFLEIAYKAYELILDEAYKKTLRTLTGSYKTDGSVMCCPVCNSTNVYEGENSMYEFTHMICRDCGNTEMADDYQIEDWYSK
jgi:hypothetical protein